MMMCSILGCDKSATARGWCPMHYQRWRSNGDPGVAAPLRMSHGEACSPVCVIDGCGKPIFNSSVWCSMHYARWKRNGSPLAMSTRRATPGLPVWDKITQKGWSEAEHDPALGPCWEFRGSRLPRGYGYVTLNGVKTTVHRASFERHHRSLSAGELVLHRCDNPPCMNPEHLVAGSHADNTADMLSKDRGGASKTTAAQRDEIACRRRGGEDAHTLAAEFGISPSRVYTLTKAENRRRAHAV